MRMRNPNGRITGRAGEQTFLERLGEFTHRRRWAVLTVWTVALVALLVVAAGRCRRSS